MYNGVLAVASRLKGDEKAEFRPVLAGVHYDVACIHALASAGKDGPKAEPKAVDQTERKRRLDLAFEHLDRAVELGWKGAEHAAKDPDLQSVRADPRWKEFLRRIGK